MDKLKVLLVASEAVPFAKVGGLADVVGALGRELARQGLEVAVAIPKYTCVYDYAELHHMKVHRTMDITVMIENEEVRGHIEEYRHDGLSYYFIDHPGYFKRSDIYVDSQTKADFADSLERFTFFCRAILEGLRLFNFKPDIIQANDWQTGLVPIYLKTVYKTDTFYRQTKCVFSIHNLSYQGIFPVEQFTVTGLDWKYFTVNNMEYYGHLNLLKGGMVFSDTVTTVSETYSREVQTPEYGNGLEGVMKDKAEQGRLFGIVNGVDYQEWDPKIDRHVKEHYHLNYDRHSFEHKKKIKKAFLEEHGIQNPDPSWPLIGIISRLVDQKGFDLIFEVIDDLLKIGVYFTVLGTGKYDYEKKFRTLAEKYPQKTAVFLKFDIPLSHHIEAASDMFIMPSRFEPCGLNQLYSLKYGTIPVARRTGGLADTVKDETTGFLFQNYNPEEFLNALKKAITIYKDKPEQWLEMMNHAVLEDWSWERAAKKYINLFRKLKTEENA